MEDFKVTCPCRPSFCFYANLQLAFIPTRLPSLHHDILFSSLAAGGARLCLSQRIDRSFSCRPEFDSQARVGWLFSIVAQELCITSHSTRRQVLLYGTSLDSGGLYRGRAVPGRQGRLFDHRRSHGLGAYSTVVVVVVVVVDVTSLLFLYTVFLLLSSHSIHCLPIIRILQPNLKVKPCSKKPTKHGTVQLNVECYGGGLWHTWLDRDLSLSGKVLVRSKENPQQISHQLVQFRDPVARVSNLAIHLQSVDERVAFKVNKEDHMSPIVGMVQPPMPQSPSAAAPSEASSSLLQTSIQQQIYGDTWKQGQEPLLLQRLADELDCSVDQIADFELNFYDTQPATVGGLGKEFLYSARLDNLATVFASMEALTDASQDLSSDADIHMVCCFDHEEVGSVSSHGAGSPVIQEAVQRLSARLNTDGDATDVYADTIAKSFILSIDQAHAVHPNYASKHEAQHAPLMNYGVVIKTNSNQRYATNTTTAFVVREIARKVGLPIQEFCGTSIGFCSPCRRFMELL
jgi:aspartyl aminopeptidase